MKPLIVKINPRIVLWSIGILGLVYLLYALRSVAILLFISFIIAAALRPFVNKLENDYGIYRSISVLFIYVLFFCLVLIISFLALDTFISQFTSFINRLPELVRNILESTNSSLPDSLKFLDDGNADSVVETLRNQINAGNLNFQDIGDIVTYISDNFNSVFGIGIELAIGVVDVLFNIFIILVVSAFLMVRKNRLYDSFTNFVPQRYMEDYNRIFERIEKGLGEWFAGQVLVMTIIGVLSYVILMIPYLVGIEGYELYKFALLLALIAGLLESLPNIGPTITAAAIVLLSAGIGESFFIIAYTFLSFIALQQVEGAFITPNIMKRVAHLDPIVTILGIVAGFQVYNVIGAILSLPTIVVVKIILSEINTKYKEREKLEESRKSSKVSEANSNEGFFKRILGRKLF